MDKTSSNSNQPPAQGEIIAMWRKILFYVAVLILLGLMVWKPDWFIE